MRVGHTIPSRLIAPKSSTSWTQSGCLWCGVQQAAEPLVAKDRAGDTCTGGVRDRCRQAQGSMRPSSVVVLDPLLHDPPQMPAAEDKQPIQALASCAPDLALHDTAFARGAAIGVRITFRPADRTTVSIPAPNLASLSRIKNRAGTPRSSSSQTRFLACWATQAASGFLCDRPPQHPPAGQLHGGEVNPIAEQSQ